MATKDNGDEPQKIPWPTRLKDRLVGYMGVGAWRQVVLTHVTELRVRLNAAEEASPATPSTTNLSLNSGQRAALIEGARGHLDAADDAANRRFGILTGAVVERAWTNIHEATLNLLELAPEDELESWGVDVRAFARLHLRHGDPHRVAIEETLLGRPPTPKPLEKEHQKLAVGVLRAAFAAASVEKTRARSFRNVVLVGSAVLAVIAVALAAFGWFHSDMLSLCFPAKATPRVSPGNVVCPNGGHSPGPYDISLVAGLGVAAAALTTAVSLSKLDGRSAPYSIPLVLALLKLPAGAVSAVLGMVMISGSLIPGLDKLDSQGQILAWAALFGAGQQAATHFVDTKGQEIIENVRGAAGLSSDSLV
ncbi:hypothetical protein ABUW04_07135 [Streptacidiphilus sp. N1-10]|uniref:Uncharacterized protein n=1 Tax=Streptacidiphilus jeojiensis TaxID=3229225 RepID=A0ABV6XJC2_9ACTN